MLFPAWLRHHVAAPLTLAVVLLFSFAGVVNAHSVMPASYNCTSNPAATSGHCYAIGTWNSGVTGSMSHEKIVSMSESPGFVSDEQWDADNTGTSWVEGGIYTGTSNGYEGMFWADERPGPPKNFHIHFGPGFTSSDFGGQLDTSIRSDGGNGFNVVLTAPHEGYSGHSYPDNFTIGSVIIGMEVSGTSGVYVDPGGASITYNGWWNSAGTLSYQGRNFDSTLLFSPPISAYWNPVAAPGNNGGDWHQIQTGS
jgi:hypothetical protein